MSRKVPEGWVPSRLGAAAANVTEKWEPGEAAEAYVGLEQIDQGTGKLLEIGASEELQSIKTRFRAGDVLFGKLRPNLRKTALVDFSGIASTDILVLRPMARMTPEFAFYRLSSDEAFDYAIKSAAGTKMPRTSWKDMADFEFPLPPLHEQRRIAEILSSVDDAVAAMRAMIEQTRKVKQGVLERLLTKGISHTRFKHTEIGEIPEGWEVGPLSRFGKVYTGKTPSTSDNESWGGDTPFVTPGDLSDECAIVAGSSRYVTEHGARQGRVMPAGAVAVTCIGSTIGKAGILGEPSMTNQQINTICCSKEVSLFVYETCVSLRSHLRRISGKQAVPIVNKSTFESIVVTHPPREEQIEISRIASGTEECVQKHIDTLKRLSVLKSALMSDLLTGRKRVTDALPMAAE